MMFMADANGGPGQINDVSEWQETEAQVPPNFLKPGESTLEPVLEQKRSGNVSTNSMEWILDNADKLK